MALKLGVVVLDCPDPWELAGFYGEVLGWERSEDDSPGDRWVALKNPDGGPDICFQQDLEYQPPTWPSNERAQMLHLDFDVDDIESEHTRMLSIGARLLDDKPKEFWVYADPAGHPFCLVRA